MQLTITIPAAPYADHDDCLAAATTDYAKRTGVGAGALLARWADEQRDDIAIEVYAETLYQARSHSGNAGPFDSVDECAETLAADGGDVLRPQRTTDEIAIVRTAKGAIVGIGGNARGKGAWVVELVPAN